MTIIKHQPYQSNRKLAKPLEVYWASKEWQFIGSYINFHIFWNRKHVHTEDASMTNLLHPFAFPKCKQVNWTTLNQNADKLCLSPSLWLRIFQGCLVFWTHTNGCVLPAVLFSSSIGTTSSGHTSRSSSITSGRVRKELTWGYVRLELLELTPRRLGPSAGWPWQPWAIVSNREHLKMKRLKRGNKRSKYAVQSEVANVWSMASLMRCSTRWRLNETKHNKALSVKNLCRSRRWVMACHGWSWLSSLQLVIRCSFNSPSSPVRDLGWPARQQGPQCPPPAAGPRPWDPAIWGKHGQNTHMLPIHTETNSIK